MSQKKKVKILLVGPVQGEFQILHDKLTALQSSKAGPFDVCFCVGPFFSESDNNESEEKSNRDLLKLPLPVYLQHYAATTSTKLNSIFAPPVLKTETTTNDSVATSSSMIELAHNLWYLRRRINGTDSSDNDVHNGNANIQDDNSVATWKVPIQNHDKPLLVASCPHRHIRESNTKQQNGNDSNQGCDLLLTDDWPQGMEDLLQVEASSSSYDVAQIAIACRPRYHIAPAVQDNLHHASPPYQIPNLVHPARFLALAPVIPGKTTKRNKYIHALGLIPILEDETSTTSAVAPAAPCPFPTDSGGRDSPPPPPPSPPRTIPLGGASTSFFSRFETGGRNKRPRSDLDNKGDFQDALEPPDDPTVSTLFLYGLHKDVTGDLQSTASGTILQAFSKYKVQKVRHPPSSKTSTYCFLEFKNQADALACLMDCCRDQQDQPGRIQLNGVSLTLKWATTSNNNKKKSRSAMSDQQSQDSRRHYDVTHKEARNSTSLYFHPPSSHGDSSDSTTAMDEAFANELRALVEKTLENALNEGNSEEDRVTAETEPALAVQVRVKDKYGFLEFASHAAATMALAALTTTTDGGTIVADRNGNENETTQQVTAPPTRLVGTVLRWAKGVESKKKDAVGRHFPPDTRTDCWFCLASPTCESHLITGVYDSWYATMPKGPIHPGHILLVPIAHSSEGAWTMATCNEMLQLKQKLVQHAAKVYEMDMFVFERAIETKGGYHTHVQCVPIPRGIDRQLEQALVTHAKESGFELRSLKNGPDSATEGDLNDLSKVLTRPDEKYFYAEIIVTGNNSDENNVYQFLYHNQEDQNDADNDFSSRRNGSRSKRVPLQFAREVLAAVFNKPDLAHWKACVVDKEKETAMAAEFRKSIVPFD